MAQYGFFFDQSRCTGCHSCSIACKVWYNIPPGPLKYMRVYNWEKGAYPHVRLHFLAIPCYHCENPVCVTACPNRAIYKEDKYGAVLIDPEICNPAIVSCNRKCWDACPYGSIVFPSDDQKEKAQKCTMCIDRLEQGLAPICVLSCSLRALEFGPLHKLKEKYGTLQELEDTPSAGQVGPAVVMRAHDRTKKKIVSWDPSKALKLWQLRGPYATPGLPPLFKSEMDVTDIGSVRVGRNELVLKARRAKELMYNTINDD
jgi:anaerobic dimethyl sulfoxide reductase subunit B (iron-sulfur subunit)